MTEQQWTTIADLVAWLDATNGRSDYEISLRILKLAEEVGEVSQAWIGTQGQNPRKGHSHSRTDVQEELVDVIVTAAVALASLTDQPGQALDAKLATIAARSAAVEGVR